MQIWQMTTQRLLGMEVAPVVPTPAEDKRFKAEDWDKNPFFDYIKQTYLASAKILHAAIADTDEAVFNAVCATLAGDFEHALQHCAIAEERTASSDDQARYRLVFLRYRIHRLAGNLGESHRLAKLLAVCNVASFRAEAEIFLQTK